MKSAASIIAALLLLIPLWCIVHGCGASDADEGCVPPSGSRGYSALLIDGQGCAAAITGDTVNFDGADPCIMDSSWNEAACTWEGHGWCDGIEIHAIIDERLEGTLTYYVDGTARCTYLLEVAL